MLWKVLNTPSLTGEVSKTAWGNIFLSAETSMTRSTLTVFGLKENKQTNKKTQQMSKKKKNN